MHASFPHLSPAPLESIVLTKTGAARPGDHRPPSGTLKSARIYERPEQEGCHNLDLKYLALRQLDQALSNSSSDLTNSHKYALECNA